MNNGYTGPIPPEALGCSMHIVGQAQKYMTDEQRLKFWQLLQEGYCKDCGRKLEASESRCHCTNDE